MQNPNYRGEHTGTFAEQLEPSNFLFELIAHEAPVSELDENRVAFILENCGGVRSGFGFILDLRYAPRSAEIGGDALLYWDTKRVAQQASNGFVLHCLNQIRAERTVLAENVQQIR
jgi:hypothetical protein